MSKGTWYRIRREEWKVGAVGRSAHYALEPEQAMNRTNKTGKGPERGHALASSWPRAAAIAPEASAYRRKPRPSPREGCRHSASRRQGAYIAEHASAPRTPSIHAWTPGSGCRTSPSVGGARWGQGRRRLTSPVAYRLACAAVRQAPRHVASLAAAPGVDHKVSPPALPPGSEYGPQLWRQPGFVPRRPSTATKEPKCRMTNAEYRMAN